MKQEYKGYLPAFLAGCILLFVPLLRDFHFESAMIAAVFGSVWGAVKSARNSDGDDLFIALRIASFLFVAAIPLFIFAVASNCLSFDGFAFWVLTPLPSVLLGVSIGRLFRKLSFKAPVFYALLMLSALGIGIFLWQFLSFPQVYFYNHVWGYWPGPIYDESVHITINYILFRSVTFLWITLFWLLPDWSGSSTKKWTFFLCFAALMFSYINYSELGFISPEQKLQEQLGEVYETEHFNIYYSPKYFEVDEIRFWAQRHEYYFEETLRRLNIKWPDSREINSYLYPHAWAKKAMVGAKFTSYVPIWLESDQLHIARQQLPGVLFHEMVHVISKQFGNDLFNGSRSIGLIEGLAEGISGDASKQSTLDQIVASQKEFPSTDEVRSSLSLTGFYSGSGAVSYTTMGSFVRFLMNSRPISNLKQSYPSGDIETYYQTPLDTLVYEWHQTLRTTEIDSTDKSISELIFAQRSLFEKSCPHTVSEELHLWDQYQFLLASKDTSAAYRVINDLIQVDDSNPIVRAEWIRSRIRLKEYQASVEAVPDTSGLLTLKVLRADAMFLQGNADAARDLLDDISDDIRKSKDLSFKYTLQLRVDSSNWGHHLQRRYSDILPNKFEFNTLSLPNQVLSLQKALELRNDSLLIAYSDILISRELSDYWFDTVIGLTTRLSYLEEFERADEWIEKFSSMSLRARFRERLDETVRWNTYLQNNSNS